MIVVTIPLPPSVNSLYRAFRQGRSVRTIMSKDGREWYKKAMETARIPGHTPLSARLDVVIYLWFPTMRRCDIDNRTKGALDVCTKAGVWEDDSLIDRLTVERRGLDRDNPRAVIEIREIAT